MALLYAKASDGYLASIPVNVMGFTQSLTTNGWQKLPSGMIYQWGELTWATSRVQGIKSILFPVVFLNVYSISGVIIASASSSNNYDSVLNLVESSATSAIFYIQRTFNNQYSSGLEYIATGS